MKKWVLRVFACLFIAVFFYFLLACGKKKETLKLVAVVKGDILEKALAVGLYDWREHKPSELSGGQQQRIALARALANDPPILLADEPTGNLDSKSGEEIMALLGDLWKGGRTIVMVTHNDYVSARSERTIRLFDGMVQT